MYVTRNRPKQFECVKCGVVREEFTRSPAKYAQPCRNCGGDVRDYQKPSRTGNCYLQRDSALRRIGYDNYKQYLDSSLWAGIRGRILIRDCGMCMVCVTKPANHVHHMKYSTKTLLGKDDENLISICAECHLKAEFSGIRKVQVTEANERIEKSIKKRIRKRKGKSQRANSQAKKPIRQGKRQCSLKDAAEARKRLPNG